VCREHVNILVCVHPELSEVPSRIRTDPGLEERQLGTMEQVNNTVIRRQKLPSDCYRASQGEGSRVNGRRDGLAWIVVGETLQV
jgi:hypothetical protein